MLAQYLRLDINDYDLINKSRRSGNDCRENWAFPQADITFEEMK